MNRGLKRGDKRACQGVNRAGEPCSSTAVGDDGWCPLHRPGADPRAMGARGGRARGKQAAELEQSDRERSKAALRRALDGGNYAAMVAAAKELIAQDRSPDREHVSVEDARAQLDARLNEIVARRLERAETCTACNGLGYIINDRRPGAGARIVGDRGVDVGAAPPQGS